MGQKLGREARPNLLPTDPPKRQRPAWLAGFRAKRLMGFEPTTFCMASARSPSNA
jgi:hypothetical protein